jgi:polyhydroxyalkanoate synthase
MPDNHTVSPRLPDPVEVGQLVTKIAGQSQRLMLGYLQRCSADPSLGLSDMSHLGQVFAEMTSRLMADPAQLVRAQMGLWQDYLALWQNSALALYGGKPHAPAPATDRRFKHDDWHANPLFDYLKQFYLMAARWILTTVREIEGADEQTAKKVDFYTRQFIDALSPTNFVLTNPEVLRTTLETGGQNLLQGLSNLLDDIERGNGQLIIKMTDLEAFELGVNVATTPGKVVYQNELMQLIQYAPTTEKVHKRPLLIVPPWINKYYILDLQPKNSFVKWAVDQGHTVFVISWVNPDETLSHKAFEDYMLEGPLAALDAIQEATGEKAVNAVGYCLGGTLLTTTLAYMAAKRDTRIKSATCFATMLDFAEPGELEVFIDDDQISLLEQRMDKDGYLDGSGMATTFNMLRANDLIWSFFINNYLLGKEPFPFDLLYWNSDSTRMPATMHSFYLRNMYQHNRLREPGGIELAGKAIDLGKIKIPMYFLSAIEDHIAPWQSTYAGPQLVSGPVRFILGGSGHIAGVINPPVKNKYYYHTNENIPEDPAAWLEGATRHEGSWWGDWDQWVAQFTGTQVAARVPGAGKLAVIEDAPGAYAKVHLHN